MSVQRFFANALGGSSTVTAPKPPPVSGGGNGYFYSTSDLSLWLSRFNNGTYHRRGQHFTNNLGDANRIISYKNAFISGGHKPLRAPSRYQTGQGAIPYPVPCWARDFFQEMAATYGSSDTMNYLHYTSLWARVMSDTSLIQSCINGFITDVTEPTLNFANRSYWQPGGSTQLPNGDDTNYRRYQTNPFFYIGELAEMYSHTYDYLKDYMTETQRAQGLAWLEGIGTFLMLNVQDMNEVIFSDYPSNQNPNPGYTGHTPSGKRTHDGGYAIPWIGEFHTNRQSSQVLGVLACGLVTNNSTLKNFAIETFKNFMKYHTYPDGTSCEFHRGLSNGLNYLSIMTHHFTKMAYLLWKYDGDDQLFTYSTSEGAGTGSSDSTAGATKSLEVYNRATFKYVKTVAGGGWDRYLGGLINGINSGKYEFAMTIAAMLMYKYNGEDEWLRNIRWKTSEGFRYPFQSAGNLRRLGNFFPENGVQGVEPDAWFMYAPDPSLLA